MTANDTSSGPAPLEYGLSPPRTKRRIVQLLVVLALLVIGYAGYQWGGYIWNQAAVMNSQRQCMNYPAPADRVVYEEEPIEAQKLLARGAEYRAYALNRNYAGSEVPRKSIAAVSFPDCWRKFSTLAGFNNPRPGQGSGAILFLHERTSSAGHRRLVCIRYFPETFSFSPQFIDEYNIEQAVYTPATWSSDASQAISPSAVDVISSFPTNPPNVRIYAGQVDPNDEKHFTIRYEMWGQTDILDGQLLNNDQVSLQPRKRPVPR